MGDTVSKEVRSFIMSRIRGRDTTPEMAVRRSLHSLGFRFRLHDKRVPGRPDLYLPRRNAAVFVHGCFWHGHTCRSGRLPKSNAEFWAAKIERNKARDMKAASDCRDMGLRVAIVWECDLKRFPAEVVAELSDWLEGDSPRFDSEGCDIYGA